VLGVTVGSPVIEFIGWRALFWGQLGLLFISAAVVALILPPTAATPSPRCPARTGAANAGRTWTGSDLEPLCRVTSLMLALSVAPLAGWSSAGTIGALCVSVVAFFVFVWRIRTAEHPSSRPSTSSGATSASDRGAHVDAFAYFGRSSSSRS